MNPLLTLMAGLVTGMLGVRMATSGRTKNGAHAAAAGLSAARGGLRDTAVSGLGTIERASAALRGKLQPGTGEPDPMPEDEAPSPAPRRSGRGRSRGTPAPAKPGPAEPAPAKRSRKRAATAAGAS